MDADRQVAKIEARRKVVEALLKRKLPPGGKHKQYANPNDPRPPMDEFFAAVRG